MSNPCPPGKVYNPKTSRCVSRKGKIGKKILKKMKSHPKKSSPKSSPLRTSPKRVSSERKSPNKSSPKRASSNRTSPKRASSNRTSPKRVSSERKSPTLHISEDGTKEWYLNGVLHREDGPAIIKINESGKEQRMWFRNGVIHREDGPAFINDRFGKTHLGWYINGVMHREDGPAVETHDNKTGIIFFKSWYLNGVKLSEEEFKEKISELRKKYKTALKEIDPLGKKGIYDYKDLYNIIGDFTI